MCLRILSIQACARLSPVPARKWKDDRLSTRFFSGLGIRLPPRRFVPSSMKQNSGPLDYDASRELLGLDVDPQPRNAGPAVPKLRSWFGPNGQYIRELPCPSCRGRGYTPCAVCDIERTRTDCSQCHGKGIRICQQCHGDCVIWEESIDERPWEKAQSSSPLKVKEDDEVDKLDIKVDVSKKSKRIYQSPSPEVSLKISKSLRSLNAKTGLFSNRMKIIHQDPILRAQRVAAIKKAKATEAARKRASETLKAFFRDPENRRKRSIAMKGVKFYCSSCGSEGHRRHYCPLLRETSGQMQFKCHLCGERGHNRRTCRRLEPEREPKEKTHSNYRHCSFCGQKGHNRRTCTVSTMSGGDIMRQQQLTSSKRTYTCSLCMEEGHNKRACPSRMSRLGKEVFPSKELLT